MLLLLLLAARFLAGVAAFASSGTRHGEGSPSIDPRCSPGSKTRRRGRDFVWAPRGNIEGKRGAAGANSKPPPGTQGCERDADAPSPRCAWLWTASAPGGKKIFPLEINKGPETNASAELGVAVPVLTARTVSQVFSFLFSCSLHKAPAVTPRWGQPWRGLVPRPVHPANGLGVERCVTRNRGPTHRESLSPGRQRSGSPPNGGAAASKPQIPERRPRHSAPTSPVRPRRHAGFPHA